MKKLTNEEFLKKLKEENIKYIPLEEYNGTNTKIKWLCYKDNSHIFENRPCNIFQGTGCPYCAGQKAFKGVNDLWTTHPEIASMLSDKNIGYEKSYGSHFITDWICPNCNSLIKQKSIHDVINHGLPCDNCSTGVSYSEKVMMSFLNQLKVDYIYDKSREWSNRKRYDFYIKDKNLIIECHGIQHYSNVSYNSFKNLEFQIKNDKEKEKLALSNGIEYYIQLDCRMSNFNYIKKSILNSKLKDLFNLNDFDWEMCNKNIYSIKNDM